MRAVPIRGEVETVNRGSVDTYLIHSRAYISDLCFALTSGPTQDFSRTGVDRESPILYSFPHETRALNAPGLGSSTDGSKKPPGPVSPTSWTGRTYMYT
jgi:hypothetical protein